MLILLQAGYSLITAFWGLLHIESFMVVTGPKVHGMAGENRVVPPYCDFPCPACLPARTAPRCQPCCLVSRRRRARAAIDVCYTAIGRISWVYLLDAGAELICLGWCVGYFRNDFRQA